jgi:hypothetical protein
MLGITRGVATLVGAAVAGFLLWLAVQMGDDTGGEYWARYAIVGAAGLTMALSQVLGGWTKWGWPRVSLGVLLLGFVPVAVLGLWVLDASQPGGPTFGGLADDLGVDGILADLGEVSAAIAFGIGLTLGLSFDTTGPRVREIEPEHRPIDTWDDRTADEPITAERHEHPDREVPDRSLPETEATTEDPSRRVISS